MKTKELLAHIRRHATDVPYSLNVHEWAEAARRACDIIEQLQKDKKKFKGIMRSIHQRALNAAPIIDIVVLSRQALEDK